MSEEPKLGIAGNIFVGLFVLCIFLGIGFGINGCLNYIANDYHEFIAEAEAEERREAYVTISNATSEERLEAEESNRRMEEYEKQRELEKALELLGE